ncbi:hypothetical protein PsorP6_000068 [Peronosclerospora sorghi]|uniref:Uncharacterized protein n=1 Tax=Peronosclerospora sorghi TaxID=230839 RepID=A0ACC0WRQ7_9STRA|nr:hypothetical protein PsorP6_000068 [Peronosclerospora sorghi]
MRYLPLLSRWICQVQRRLFPKKWASFFRHLLTVLLTISKDSSEQSKNFLPESTGVFGVPAGTETSIGVEGIWGWGRAIWWSDGRGM